MRILPIFFIFRQIFNNITIGKYDVVVVAGATLPTNRYAELEFYMDAYQKGLIDREEVLKKTEVFDIEGVLERTETIGQLQQQIMQSQEMIKKLKGDLQTRDREAVNLRKRLEVEKFASGLDKVSNKSSAASTLYEKRLDDTLATVKNQIKDYVSDLDEKEKGSPSSGKKQSKKQEKK